MLVFEGPPCILLGLSFPAGSSKGWAGAMSGIYFSSTEVFEMTSCLEVDAYSPLHPAPFSCLCTHATAWVSFRSLKTPGSMSAKGRTAWTLLRAHLRPMKPVGPVHQRELQGGVMRAPCPLSVPNHTPPPRLVPAQRPVRWSGLSPFSS